MSDQLQSLAFLLQHCESFAKTRLRETGQFGPFAAFVEPGATNLNLLGALPANQSVAAAETHSMLETALVELAAQGKVAAYAIAASVNMPESLQSPLADGIRIHIEARGYSRLIYTPYRVLPYRAVRHFFLLLPCVEYATEITIDVEAKLFPTSVS